MRRWNHALVEEYLRLSEMWNRTGTATEVADGWSALWERHVANGKSRQTHVDDVGHLAHLGWRIHGTRGDFRSAMSCLDPYFEHPDLELADGGLRTGMERIRAISLLYLGDEPGGCEAYLSLLEHPDRRVGDEVALSLRHDLYVYCSRRPAHQKSSPQLSGLVLRTLGERPLHEARTYDELCQSIIEATPEHERAEALRVAEQSPW